MIPKIRAPSPTTPPAPAPPTATQSTFRNFLHLDSLPSRATSSTELSLAGLQATLTDLDRQHRRVDQLIARARSGHVFGPAELIGLQATVYRYAHQMEVLSRVVDRSVAAVKTLLNTQV